MQSLKLPVKKNMPDKNATKLAGNRGGERKGKRISKVAIFRERMKSLKERRRKGDAQGLKSLSVFFFSPHAGPPSIYSENGALTRSQSDIHSLARICVSLHLSHTSAVSLFY